MAKLFLLQDTLEMAPNPAAAVYQSPVPLVAANT